MAEMFVPSWTMENQIHCDERESEVILGDDYLIHIYENNVTSSSGGVHSAHLKTLKSEKDKTMEIHPIRVVGRSRKVLISTHHRFFFGGKKLFFLFSHSTKIHSRNQNIRQPTPIKSIVYQKVKL